MFVDKEDMKEVDKIWVRGEIANKLDDLKIRESERSFNSLVNGLDTRIARVEGQISAPSRPPHPWITPVIALVGTALIAFQGWMGVTLVQHGNKLSGMQGSLLQLGITVAANDPTSSKGQSEARVALADARKLKTSIPVAAVQEAGKSFFEAAKSAPKASTFPASRT